MRNVLEQPRQEMSGIERFFASPSLQDTTGIAVVLFNRKGQLAVVEELRTKPELTLPGQHSVPIETRKKLKLGEPRRDTILGALAELVDDKVLAEVGSSAFQWPPQAPAIYRPGIEKNGVALQGELHVVRFQGDPEYPLHPTATDEVAFAGWQEPLELFNSKLLRPAARMPLARVITNGTIELVVRENNPSIDLFGPDFSMTQFYNRRELLKDLV